MIPVSNKIGFGDEMGPVATDLHTESMTECEAKEEVNMLMDQSNIKIIHIQASKSLDCLPVVRNYTNNVKRIVSIRPPIDLYKLKVIEKAFNPPDIEVLHELYFNPKMKLSTEMMRRLCRIDDLNSEETNVYWRHLATEIQALKNEKGLNSEHFPILCITLEEIKNMLLHLYPKSMILHDQLVPLLDSEFLVQQLTYGALDIDGLTQILGETLKKNCAPKRDALVERIIKLGSSINGDWLGMLRACLELMELMKYKRDHFLKGIAERERIYFEFMFRSNSNFSLANTKRWLRVPIKTNIKSFDHHDFSLAAFVRLICTEECLDNIPETLALDQRRIREMHGLFHELCVLGGSMLLFKQWTEDSYVTPALSQEFKARVTRALAASHFDMDDLARQILLVISRGRKTPIRGINRSILEAMIGNAMSPHHQVFKLIKEQISTIIKRACSVAAMILSNEQEGRLISQTFLNKDDVRRAGLIPMYDELSYVAGKYGTLWALHWKVHSELYTRILT